MHEFSIIQDIFNTLDPIVEKNHLTKITAVKLQLGAARQCIPEFLQFAFKEISKGSIGEGAELIITEIPITLKCDECGKEFSVKENCYICPGCGGVKLQTLTGMEIILDSLEGE